MKKALIILGSIVGFIAIVILGIILSLPAMDRWGSSDAIINTGLPGDDLVPAAARVTNRSINIKANPDKIYPWILQIGADKSGMYSYSWLENLVGCKMAKEETIHSEWQTLQPGDMMKMCAGEFAPPPYVVAQAFLNQAVIFGHKDDTNAWQESWSFSLVQQPDGSTTLVSRSRTQMTGGFWEVIRPITFMMEAKMLETIKTLAEE